MGAVVFGDRGGEESRLTSFGQPFAPGPFEPGEGIPGEADPGAEMSDSAVAGDDRAAIEGIRR